MLFPRWHPSQHHRAVTRRAVDVQLAAKTINALLHARQSKTDPLAALFGVKTNPVVANANSETTIRPLQGDIDLAGARVSAGILQRLLRDPEKAERDRRRWVDEAIFDSHIDRNRLEPREPFALGLQCLDKSEIVEDGRMQPVRQCMNILAELD